MLQPTLSGLITFVIELVLAGLVIYAIYWFIGILALPQPLKNVVVAIVAIIALLWLLGVTGLYSFPVR